MTKRFDTASVLQHQMSSDEDPSVGLYIHFNRTRVASTKRMGMYSQLMTCTLYIRNFAIITFKVLIFHIKAALHTPEKMRTGCWICLKMTTECLVLIMLVKPCKYMKFYGCF